MLARRIPRYVKRGIGGIDANTVLMLHGEDFSDSSGTNKLVVNTGTTVNSSIRKFGTSSLYFNGSSRLKATDSGFAVGVNDFTMEAWVYVPSANVNYSGIFCIGPVQGDSGLHIRIYGTTGLQVWTGTGYVIVNGIYTINNVFALNTWWHIACVRNRSTITTYINGKAVHSFSTSFSMVSGTVNLGSAYSDLDDYFSTIYLDEFRFSDIARWTANFVPPTEPYSK